MSKHMRTYPAFRDDCEDVDESDDWFDEDWWAADRDERLP